MQQKCGGKQSTTLSEYRKAWSWDTPEYERDECFKPHLFKQKILGFPNFFFPIFD